MSKNKKKIIAIVGTTASGKTNLAVELCLEFDGEVVSADSRQVYKYMDIGSGKDLVEYRPIKNGEEKIVPYHLIDVVHPNENFDLYKWLVGAKNSISDILARHKLPVLAGGTGLYTQALLDGFDLSKEKIDQATRVELEGMTKTELFSRLLKLDPAYAKNLNESERNNQRRLVRELELKMLGKKKSKPITKPYDSLVLGLTQERAVLRDRIAMRLDKRFREENMLDEVKDLHEIHGVTYERLESFGLEYRLIAQHLQGKIGMEEMKEKLFYAIWQFSKRQMTWLRRWEKQGQEIFWPKDLEEAKNITRNFLQT